MFTTWGCHHILRIESSLVNSAINLTSSTKDSSSLIGSNPKDTKPELDTQVIFSQFSLSDFP